MIEFLKSLFKSESKFPATSSKMAFLFIDFDKSIKDPMMMQLLAADTGAPIICDYNAKRGIVIGRLGIPKVEFPPSDIGVEYILDKTAEYLQVLRNRGIKYSLSSGLLCEADHNKLLEFLASSETYTKP